MTGYNFEWIAMPCMMPATIARPTILPLVALSPLLPTNKATVSNTGRITTKLSADPRVHILIANGLYIHQRESISCGLCRAWSIVVSSSFVSSSSDFLAFLRRETMIVPHTTSATQNNKRPKYRRSSHQVRSDNIEALLAPTPTPLSPT